MEFLLNQHNYYFGGHQTVNRSCAITFLIWRSIPDRSRSLLKIHVNYGMFYLFHYFPI